jgi:type I restriction enzyme, S subunit
MSWPTAALGDLCQINIGRTPSRSVLAFWEGGDHPWLAISDMGRSKEIRTTKEGITEAAIDACNMRLVNPGTVLFSFKLSIGKVGIASVPLFTNEAIASLPILDSGILCEEFLIHALEEVSQKLVGDRAAMGMTLNKASLAEIQIPLPPLEEQRRIAAILDKAENLRFLALLSSNTLASFKEAVFLDIFGSPTQSLGPWPVVPLGEAARLENGDRSANYPSGGDIKEDGIPFLSTKNIVNNKLDFSKTAFISPDKFNSLSQGKARTGDLVITLRGTLGSCCIFSCSHETAFINAQMMLIRPRETLLPVYLHALLTTSVFQSKLQSLGYGAAVRQLSSGQLSRLAIPVPPISTQLEFSRRLDRTLEAINSCNVRHEKLNQMLHSIQVQAFCENRNV